MSFYVSYIQKYISDDFNNFFYRYQKKRCKNTTNVLEDIVQKPNKLQSLTICEYYNARRFSHEIRRFCCSDGEIYLKINDTPKELYDLYTFTSSDTVKFRNYIRTYNNNFVFTSFNVKYYKNLCKNTKDIYISSSRASLSLYK
ncbi:hypothetical protein TorRG33x02_181440 [Trema orientale]|uniref:Uncharacterized protein n=1 Tax=Trema orientale TaxID=63057 RepID=A0A2P5EKP1_TREOI|nr:hypothetical protein TorRG33x02_181440 [Trema orientale]